MLDKKGFSMIEVIICMAIVAVLSVSAFSLSDHLQYANVKKCAKQLNQKLETARMVSMSKSGQWQFYVYKEDDGIYYYLTNSGTLDRTKGVKLGSSDIKLYATPQGGTETEITAGDGNVVHIHFTKNTGSFTTKDGATIYESIRMEKKSSNYVMKLIAQTGKHYIE